MKKIYLSMFFVLFLMTFNAHAELVNPGFEQGINGWTITESYEWQSYTEGEAFAYNSYDDIEPYDGNYFLGVKAIGGSGLSPDQTRLSQAVYLTQGQILDVWFAYKAAPVSEILDDGYGFIQVQSGNFEGPFDWGITHHNSEGNLSWTLWSFTAPRTGYFTIHYGITSYASPYDVGIAFFDASVKNTIPEPTTMLLLGLGLIGLAGVRRKIKK